MTTKNTICMGIDLGTTNSSVNLSVIDRDGNLKVVPHYITRSVRSRRASFEGPTQVQLSDSSDLLLPSAVHYGADNRIHVGDYALEMAAITPERTALSIKSQMGNDKVTGLAQDVADVEKTPEQISSRILKQIRTSLIKEYGPQLDFENTIITVPANFNLSARQATLRAAELAGFKVRNADGSYRNILISEPCAVMYKALHLIQQNRIRDFLNLARGEAKTVCVVDIGGGTIDVSILRIVRDEETDGVMNIEEIASPRYTNVAGDRFDSVIAEKLFLRYLSLVQRNAPNLEAKVISNRAMLTQLLKISAETLKKKMGATVESLFGDVSVTTTVDLVQNLGLSYSYNDRITSDEFSEMISELLGNNLSYEDFPNFMKRRDVGKNNIIAPILEALDRADGYFYDRDEDMIIDHVVLNGGMTSSFAVSERIERLFGMRPIVLPSPSTSVSEGAALYAALNKMHDLSRRSINVSKRYQSDSIYLGLHSGNNKLLIPSGTELPYTGSINGLRITSDSTCILFPVKTELAESEQPSTVAATRMLLRKSYGSDSRLDLDYHISEMGLLDVSATVRDGRGAVLERSKFEFLIGENVERIKNSSGCKLLPNDGAILDPANTLYTLKSSVIKPPATKKGAREKIKVGKGCPAPSIQLGIILNAGNPEDFENAVIRELRNNTDTGYRYYLYRIAEQFFTSWSDYGIRTVSEISSQDINPFALDPEIRKLSDYVLSVRKKIEADTVSASA